MLIVGARIQAQFSIDGPKAVLPTRHPAAVRCKVSEMGSSQDAG